MSLPSPITRWQEEIRTHLPHLSGPQSLILALWSYATVVCNSCGLTTVVGLLATIVLCKKANLRQRLGEWSYDVPDKAGRSWSQVDVRACFAPLVQWILSDWPQQEKHLTLAIDATTLGKRLTVVAVSVQYRGSAILVAWSVMKAYEKGPWRPLWEDLLERIAPAIPAGIAGDRDGGSWVVCAVVV